MPCRFGLWDIAKQLDAVFAQMDIDGDGVLTPDEFLEGFGTTSVCCPFIGFLEAARICVQDRILWPR